MSETLTTWVCPPCTKGWQSTATAGETCSRCGRLAVVRGSYQVIDLKGREQPMNPKGSHE